MNCRQYTYRLLCTPAMEQQRAARGFSQNGQGCRPCEDHLQQSNTCIGLKRSEEAEGRYCGLREVKQDEPKTVDKLLVGLQMRIGSYSYEQLYMITSTSHHGQTGKQKTSRFYAAGHHDGSLNPGAGGGSMGRRVCMYRCRHAAAHVLLTTHHWMHFSASKNCNRLWAHMKPILLQDP